MSGLGAPGDLQTPAIPFGNIQSSLIQPPCQSKGICCKLKLRNTILPKHSSKYALWILKPDLATRTHFSRLLFLLLLPLVITFFLPIVILFTPRRQTNERTSKRTNERSATTMTTTIETTTMLMTTPPLLHVAQKGQFKIFKLDYLAIVPIKCTIPWAIPNAYYD
ncbi:hypothetical protein [Absidia glauca]|uniref:Ndc10 domain-containing protein n=1 Tax=Absidia glauca TaxID=4829 RepID=A0A168RNP8_ABSGL|nr:hypothetical protein [Absidia glauca]